MARESSGFIFVEFEEGAKAVEVLRPGTFVDRNGKTVEIADEDLDAFVANFEAGAAGQEVPVDVLHERAEAAGWVKRLFLEGGKLLAEVEWNELGKQLVGDKVYRYLSATIDEAKKLVKSISLVNFPAVKGLQPVELGEGVYTLQAETGLLERLIEAIRSVFGGESEQAELVIRKEESEIVLYSADGKKVLGRFPFGEGKKYADEEAARKAAVNREREVQYFKHQEAGSDKESETMNEKELAELREKIRQEIVAEMAEQAKTRAELEEQVRKEVEAELTERLAERQKLVEFAERVCGKDGAGLSEKPDELERERVMAILESKVVEFGERGSAREGRGGKKELGEPYAMQLREWLDAECDLDEWFKLNADVVGDQGDYELSEFEKK